MNNEISNSMRWHVVSEFQKISTERYEIWTLKAQHMKTENALFYLINQGDKAFMQCNDTGLLWEENYEFLSSLGVKIDAISLDCTMGAQEESYFGHMNLKECLETVERMRKSNFVKPDTRFILTHFCHNGILFLVYIFHFMGAKPFTTHKNTLFYTINHKILIFFLWYHQLFVTSH